MKTVKTNAKCYCGNKMTAVYFIDEYGKSGYYLYCEKCGIYFGLYKDEINSDHIRGYFQLDNLIKDWNKITGRNNYRISILEQKDNRVCHLDIDDKLLEWEDVLKIISYLENNKDLVGLYVFDYDNKLLLHNIYRGGDGQKCTVNIVNEVEK